MTGVPRTDGDIDMAQCVAEFKLAGFIVRCADNGHNKADGQCRLPQQKA